MGRRGGRSPVETMRLLARAEGRSGLWRYHGFLMIAIAILGSSFFSVISGWCVAYIPLELSDSFSGADAERSARLLQNLTDDPVRMAPGTGSSWARPSSSSPDGVSRGLGEMSPEPGPFGASGADGVLGANRLQVTS